MFHRTKKFFKWLLKTIAEKTIDHIVGLLIAAIVIGPATLYLLRSHLISMNDWFMVSVMLNRWYVALIVFGYIFACALIVYLGYRIRKLNSLHLSRVPAISNHPSPIEKISVTDNRLGLTWEVSNNTYWHNRANLDRDMIGSYVEGPFDAQCHGFAGTNLGKRGSVSAYVLVHECKSCGRPIPLDFATNLMPPYQRAAKIFYQSDMKIVVIRALQQYLRAGNELKNKIQFDELPYSVITQESRT